MNQIPIRDIHLPESVSSWPPAIGWWLLPLFLIAAAIFAYYMIRYIKRIRSRLAYKKIALAELERIKKNSLNNKHSIEHLRAISTLLRRIALSYLPRESVASLTGNKWIDQLNSLTQDTFFSNELGMLLANAPYCNTATFNLDEIISICEQWIGQLPDHVYKEARPA